MPARMCALVPAALAMIVGAALAPASVNLVSSTRAIDALNAGPVGYSEGDQFTGHGYWSITLPHGFSHTSMVESDIIAGAISASCQPGNNPTPVTTDANIVATFDVLDEPAVALLSLTARANYPASATQPHRITITNMSGVVIFNANTLPATSQEGSSPTVFVRSYREHRIALPVGRYIIRIDGEAFSQHLGPGFWSSGSTSARFYIRFIDADSACSIADMAGPAQSRAPDSELTADDIIVFIGYFFNGDLHADIAGPGQTPGSDLQFTADDLIYFIGAFFDGC